MKLSIFIKVFLIFPVILFIDYILMALFGGIASIFGLGNDFYCGTYCIVGKIVLALSVISFLFFIFPDIVAIFKTPINGPSTKE
jgi:hypothetical protein